MSNMAKSLDLREFGYPLFESEKEACEYFGIGVTTFISRRNKGMSVIEALTTKSKYVKTSKYKVKPIIVEGKQYDNREEACKAYGINLSTVTARQLRQGISFEEALVKPIQPHSNKFKNPVEVDGVTVYSYDDACNKFGIARSTLHYRMNNLKMSLADALKFRPNTKVMFDGCKLYKYAGKFFIEFRGYDVLDTYDSKYKLRYFVTEMFINHSLKIAVLNTSKKDGNNESEVSIESVDVSGYKAYKIDTKGEIGTISIKIAITDDYKIITFDNNNRPSTVDNEIVRFTLNNIIKIVSIIGDFDNVLVCEEDKGIYLEVHSHKGDSTGILRYDLCNTTLFDTLDFVMQCMDRSSYVYSSHNKNTDIYNEVFKALTSKWRVHRVIYNLPYMKVLERYTKFKCSYTIDDINKLIGAIPCRTMLLYVDHNTYFVDITNTEDECFIQYIRYSNLGNMVKAYVGRHKLSCSNDIDLEILNLLNFITNYSKKKFKVLEKETRHIKNVNSANVINIATLDEEFRELEIKNNRTVYKYIEKPNYNHTDRKQSPHYRSGYTRNQRYGKDRQLVKQVRIDPTFVNKDKNNNADPNITVKTYK